MSRKAKKDHLAKPPSPSGVVVRRAFSMQETDAQLIEALRVRYATQGLLVNQSEVIRVGLHALSRMTDADLRECASKLERLTTSSRARQSK